mgnify:FL=1
MAEVQNLTDRIINDAKSVAQNNIEQAEKEAGEIMKAAESDAIQKKNQMIQKAKEQAVETKKRMIAVAGLEARKKKLEAKQKMIGKAFSKALEKLNSMEGDSYYKTLENMIVNSITRGNERILLSDKDKVRIPSDFIDVINKKLVQKGLKGEVKIADEKTDIKGGFILKSGGIEINDSFESLMRMNREDIEDEVVSVMFEKEGV